jgi:hypothetical protein
VAHIVQGYVEDITAGWVEAWHHRHGLLVGSFALFGINGVVRRVLLGIDGLFDITRLVG